MRPISRQAKASNLALDDKSSLSALGDIGNIDLLLASPECTSHTCAHGSRPPEEESRRTANYVLAFAAELKPRWVVVENVIHMRGWQGYPPLLEALSKEGYRVRIEVLDASRFGVPQIRKRLFILADRERIPRHIPRRRGRPPSARRILDPDGLWKSGPLRSEARAMGFGDDYILDAVRQRRDRIKILGNGVPPPVMKAIVETLTDS